jgi:hypothetical protein
MLRTSVIAAGLALILSIPALIPAPAPAEVEFEGFKKHKVTICHFEGHDNTSPRGGGDFVTHNWITLGNPVCDREGGMAIVVSAQGCKNGHDAYARYGRTCDEGANQAGAP